MNAPKVSLVGHVAARPSLRTTPGGHPVADFRVATTPRRRRVDPRTGGVSWSDEPTLWCTVTVWRALAERCAVTLDRGARVVVQGDLRVRAWTGQDGVARSGLEICAQWVGLDLQPGRAASVPEGALSVSPPRSDAARGAGSGRARPDGRDGLVTARDGDVEELLRALAG